MKKILLACLLLASAAQGSGIALFTVKQPLYLHGSDQDVTIRCTPSSRRTTAGSS